MDPNSPLNPVCQDLKLHQPLQNLQLNNNLQKFQKSSKQSLSNINLPNLKRTLPNPLLQSSQESTKNLNICTPNLKSSLTALCSEHKRPKLESNMPLNIKFESPNLKSAAQNLSCNLKNVGLFTDKKLRVGCRSFYKL